ncbi:MAG: sodium:solute symporter family protein [Pseudomonadota bacterium]
MRTLAALDYVVIASYLAIVLAVGVVLTKRAGESVENFFVGGRGMPWWLIGVSMAATNFSIDTPISITGFVGREGIGGVWFFWASAISAVLVTFLFARLWRRAGVITDAEIIEGRYSGRSASFLRLFKGFYFGVIFNAFIMGWVFLALAKVIGGVTDLDVDVVLVVATVLVFGYTVASGFYGVVLTDFFQYFVAILGSVLLAVYAVAEAGGLRALAEGLEARHGPGVTAFFPGFDEGSLMPLSVFLVYVMVQWWAHKYADGGGKHIQRMLSAKNEDHAVAASFFFTFANYALQVWPWILTALAALLVFGPMDDPEMGYPMMMARVLPAGVLGLVVVCLIGAFMSTIDTHLNLGASYIINDIYRRFMVKDASDRHYVFASRVAMGLLLAVAVILSRNMDSVGGAWKFLLTFASGAGLTWIVRWFWWRANAWTELSAMVTSGVVATYIKIAHNDWLYSSKLLVIVGVTTVVWVAVTFLTPPVDDARLADFLRRVRPGSPGWAKVARRHGITQRPFLVGALLLWLVGLVALFSLNFGIGSLLLLRTTQGLWLLALSAVSLVVLWAGVRRYR